MSVSKLCKYVFVLFARFGLNSFQIGNEISYLAGYYVNTLSL